MEGSPGGQQRHLQLEQLRRRNEDAEMAKVFERVTWGEEAKTSRPYVLSLETA